VVLTKKKASKVLQRNETQKGKEEEDHQNRSSLVYGGEGIIGQPIKGGAEKMHRDELLIRQRQTRERDVKCSLNCFSMDRRTYSLDHQQKFDRKITSSKQREELSFRKE